jgi:hypothetical protein
MGLSVRQGILAAIPIIAVLASCGGGVGSSSGISTSVESSGSRPVGTPKTLGDIQVLDLSSGSTTIAANEPGSDYILVVNSTEQTGSDSTIRLSAGGAATALSSDQTALAVDAGAVAPDVEEAPAEQFHSYLRAVENMVTESGQFTPLSQTSSSNAALEVAPAPAIGDTEDFNVISTMSSLTTFDTVTGQLRFASDNLYVYVDQADADNIADTDIQTLAHNFEDIALPRERALFGHESDINLDGHIAILMTCTVNRMAAKGGIVTGFFFPGDLYQRSSVNPASNAREIFYTLVPDPEGKCGTAVTADFAVNQILPGVIAHEYQHMDSFQQHVFKNHGSPEEPWLNECLSHFTEDITGFGHENPSRMKLFFSQPSQTSIISAGTPTLAERGACYTFLRYLYEQSPDGDAFITNLYSSSLTGVGNLETAYNSASGGGDPDFDRFPEFVNRWSLALSLSGTGATFDPRYNYQERETSTETGNLTGLCVRCDAQDGRGTILAGPVTSTVATYPSTNVLKGTASQFYHLTAPISSLTITDAGDSTLAGALIRLQ